MSAAPVIEARSQAQALDWSLVLISQGIESVPVRREGDGAWTLEIAGTDWERATESIAAYERENATVWRREVKWTGLLFDARAILPFAALILFHLLVERSSAEFKASGILNRDATLHGEWWRLGTAMTLHADLAHLAANVTTGLVFLGLAMGCFGPGVALLLAFLGGALGNVATLAVHESPFHGLGASGFVMASLGLLTAHSLAFARHEKPTVWIGRGVIAGCLLVVLLGFSVRSDVVAHIGGFVAGVVLGIGALQFRGLLARRGINAVALIILIALITTTWWRALHP